MINNNSLLRAMFARGIVELNEAPFLFEDPPPMPPDLDFDRVEGMLLGLAIGDALGNTSESQLPEARQKHFGEIRHYLPNKFLGSQPVGLPSDDTQLAFWTLEQTLVDGGLVPDHLAHRFSQERIFGIGNTVKGFLRAYKERGEPWYSAGLPSAGNGALMRIAPVLVPHLRHPSGLWADTVLSGMLTHNDRASNTSCVTFVHMLWDVLRSPIPPTPYWWLDEFCRVASLLEGPTSYECQVSEVEYRGPMWQFTCDQVRRALRSAETVVAAGRRFHSGAYLLETVPSVVHIMCLYGNHPEEAIVRAVNDTWDNDTIAAIVGAAVGAVHGKSGFPSRWIDNLLGRTNDRDDRKIFRLIEQARETFFA